MTEGIKQAISLLNTLLSNPTAPLPGNPVPIAQRHDASVLLVVEKDRMSATAQITADWGGKYLTSEQLEQAIQSSEISQGVQAPLIAAAVLAAKEATPGTLLRLPVAQGKAAVNGQDTRFERLVETPAERILKPQELDHGRVDMRDLHHPHRQGRRPADAPPPRDPGGAGFHRHRPGAARQAWQGQPHGSRRGHLPLAG